MLIKLYDRPFMPPVAPGVINRKPIGAEYDLVVDWVKTQFGPGWASEARAALIQRPAGIYIALDDAALIGFCCHNATALGFVGPIGVAESCRGRGVGAALLLSCLYDMRAMGYAYAVAGAVGAPDFFRRVAGATEIEGSTPGLYRGMLRG